MPLTPLLRPALGLFIIAHGLAHAVLPSRGWMDPATLALNFMPLILYTVAVVGFTVAGLGVLGVRPFTGAARPALVVAAGYSLVAIGCAGQGDLKWAAVVDPGLLLVGATGAYLHLPVPNGQGGLLRKTVGAVGVALVIYATAAVVLWPPHRTKAGDPSLPAWTAALQVVAVDFPHLIIERGLMLRKSPAEAGAGKAL
jgi:hypothetical protein